jgi:hypothetical protein
MIINILISKDVSHEKYSFFVYELKSNVSMEIVF